MRDRRGFGLAETAVVIVILGVLAVIAIPNFIQVKKRAMEASVKGNAHALQLVVEEWSTDHAGVLPVLADLGPAQFPGGVFPDNPFNGNPFLLGAPGGYIFAPAHSVPGDVPVENLVAMIETVTAQLRAG